MGAKSCGTFSCISLACHSINTYILHDVLDFIIAFCKVGGDKNPLHLGGIDLVWYVSSDVILSNRHLYDTIDIDVV